MTTKPVPSTYIFLALTIAIGLTLAWPYRISGNCMEPAISDGHLYFVNKISPYLRRYKIGDVILFNRNNHVWISRIVALGSDKIQISDRSVILNDDARLSNDIKRNWLDWKFGTYAINRPFYVPLKYVYVLSDNLSAHHDDSRVFGPIPVKSIIGIIWM